MDELKEIKLKNYQYLNEVAIKGRRSSRSSLMELFPFVKSLGVEVLTTSSTIEHQWPEYGWVSSAYSFPCFWMRNRARCLSISVPMTWPRSLMETNGSNIWQLTSGRFWSKHKLSCLIQRFTLWLSTQPIFICLGRPRLQSSGWNCGHLKSWPLQPDSWGNRPNLWLPLY